MKSFVAVALGRREFEKIVEFAGKNPEARIKCVCLDYVPEPGLWAENVRCCKAKSLLSPKEIDLVYERAEFFARNWYRFSPEFEKGLVASGIQLGYVSELPMFNILNRIFFLLKAVSNAVALDKAAAVVAAKQSFAGECGRIAARHMKVELVQLELQPEKQVSMRTNISFRKAAELWRKLGEIAHEASSLKRRPGAKTVFVRGNNYLGGLPGEMRKNPKMNVVSLETLTLRKMLNPLLLARYFRLRAGKRAFFRALLKRFVSGKAFREKMVFEGMAFADAFALRMPRFTDRDWPEFAFLAEILLQEFERHRPSAVVLWDDFIPFERICAMLAKSLGAKSLVVQHGVFRPDREKGDWVKGYAPLTADRIAVWSERFKSYLVGHMVPAEKVIVTGPPRFDALHNRVFDRAGFRKRLGIKPDEKLVVFPSEMISFNETVVKEILGWFEEDLPKSLKARFAVKIRSYDDFASYSLAAGGKAVILQDVDLYELLNASDAVVASVSTVGLEGMVLGKPFIAYRGQDAEGNIYETDDILRANNRQELKEAMLFALDEKNKAALQKRQQRFVFDITFRQDGRATERVMDIAEAML